MSADPHDGFRASPARRATVLGLVGGSAFSLPTNPPNTAAHFSDQARRSGSALEALEAMRWVTRRPAVPKLAAGSLP